MPVEMFGKTEGFEVARRMDLSVTFFHTFLLKQQLLGWYNLLLMKMKHHRG